MCVQAGSVLENQQILLRSSERKFIRKVSVNENWNSDHVFKIMAIDMEIKVGYLGHPVNDDDKLFQVQIGIGGRRNREKY